MQTTPRIEIFRAGIHTAVDGSRHEFTPAHLAASVAAYDAAAEPAPLVVGHPDLNVPAYGWVGKLTVEGDKIVADPIDLEPAFAEQVRAGRYRRVSASWYPPEHPQNPKPGSFYLKHVGFLGAAAPAVRGLAPVHFSEAQIEGALTIDTDLKEITVSDRTAEFAEKEAALSARETELSGKEQEVVAREATVIAAERKAVHDGHVAFAEAQIGAGRLAPAGRALVVGLLDTLAAATQPVNFGEADGELPPVAAFRKLLEGAAPIVSFAELAPAEPEKTGAPEPEGIAVKAVAFAQAEEAAGRTVSIQAAVRHVMKTTG